EVEGLLGRLARGERPLADTRPTLEALASQPGLFVMGTSAFLQEMEGTKPLPLPVAREFSLVAPFDGATRITLRMGSSNEAAQMAAAVLNGELLLQARAGDPELERFGGFSLLMSALPSVDVVGQEVRLVTPANLGSIIGSQLPNWIRLVTR